MKKLLCKLNLHDWRYASHAPNRRYGDICGVCQRCGERRVLKGFDLWFACKLVKLWHSLRDRRA